MLQISSLSQSGARNGTMLGQYVLTRWNIFMNAGFRGNRHPCRTPIHPDTAQDTARHIRAQHDQLIETAHSNVHTM